MGYHVNLPVLDGVVQSLDATQATLDRRLRELDAIVASLAGVWDGRTAAAQRAAHRRWRTHASDMHLALRTLHDAAHTAHTNYTSAHRTNVTMWEQVQ